MGKIKFYAVLAMLMGHLGFGQHEELDLKTISRTYIDAYFGKSIDIFASMMADEVEWSDPTWAEVDPSTKLVSGKTKVLQHLKQATAEIQNMSYAIDHHFVSGNFAVFEGTLNYEWKQEATGKVFSFSMREVSVLEFESGLIVKHTDYTDFKRWKEQYTSQLN
ncbi:nuclear transport factor 2 family protein [Muricauda sp. 2012CJ35-5]|uniref:Nuclear transport factor 2 family protein n=1 Tax=Flagellimonas spongiicola TaxID=2942208 RepID=A0ABT0PMN6_9FLAO|nr:nuclear transport factor 2 family protein [Allomuricauda spongiicola]MCL6272625.1 nuclear transport factor 2 family protein [Allomuricauda spongiicola]